MPIALPEIELQLSIDKQAAADKMKGNTSIVFENKTFEFCMKQLGWSYEKANGYYH